MRTFRLMSRRVAATLAMAAALAAPSAMADGWWPGGGDDAKPAAEEAAADDSTMVDSPLFKMSWPKIQMPKLSWKPGFGGSDGERPSGVTPEGNPISRALDKVADSSKKAADNVRGAWGSAVSKLPFGGGQATQTAQNDGGGFWSRMFSTEEERQPQTMQEFIAQDRVGTTR